MSLFESVILLDVVEIISSNDDGSLHLGRNHDSPIIIIIINKTKRKRRRNRKSLDSARNLYLLEDSSSNGNIRSEWALFVNVLSFNSFSWGLESYKMRVKPQVDVVLPRPIFL